MMPFVRLCPLALAITLALPQLAWAQSSSPSVEEHANNVSLNFANADIESVIKAIGKISGHNFLIDPRVKGTLNIVTNTPVPRKMTYDILLSALRLQGFTAVEGQGITKIVPETDARLHATPVSKDTKPKGGEQLVTQVFTLKYEPATQMLNVIRPLIAPNNTINAFPGNNSLVITDYADNIARISRVIDSIDVPQNGMITVALRYAAAADVAETITKLMGNGSGSPGSMASSQGDSTQMLNVVADARSNSVLIRAENPAKLMAVRKLIESIDRPGAGGNIHVVYLKNADATLVAQTLNNILAGQGDGTTGQGNKLSNTDNKSAQNSNSTNKTNSSSNNSTPRLANNNNNANQKSSSGPVQADPGSNALIITAPDAIYNNLRHVIDQLDRRRAQIFVEALIVEITDDRASNIGIQWNANKGNVVGGTNFSPTGQGNILSAISSTGASVGKGLNLLVGGGTLTLGGQQITTLGFLANFLESDNRANILSTPNIITLDNEEARIVVGQTVPMKTGSYSTTSGTTVSPFNTYERQDVGLTLQVKPKITEGGLVHMQIYQEASSVVENSSSSSTSATAVGNDAGPTTNKRAIESSVLVDDGSIIALGGLVQDKYSGNVEKVPYLGDIPVLGQLFRYDNRSRTKTNLVVFLRPVILRTAEDNARITNPRYDYVIGQQRQSAQPRDLMPKEKLPPELPDFGAPPPALPESKTPKSAYTLTPAEQNSEQGVPFP